MQFLENERRIWQSVDVLDQVVVQAMAEVKVAKEAKEAKVAMVVVAEGIVAVVADL